MELRDQLQGSLGTAYTLERELGGGGMSRVFLATETALGRSVVVKVLPPELLGGVNIERFHREIQVAARLQHPHIVPVLAAGAMDGVPYYTMPFVEGRSLRARLDESGALPISEAAGLLRDVAKALAYAHERGIVHRDIKPDNVMVSGGAAVVTDFGIAKALSEAKTAQPSATLTQMGTSLGTPAYMAPEQAAADPSANHRADIYAFGCMAYEVLAGRPPFHGRSPAKLLAAQMGETPAPLSQLRPDTPPALASLVMRCLEKEADDRPQRAADLVRMLESVTTSEQNDAMPAILLGGRKMLGKALVVYVVAFVAVAIIAKAAIVAIGLPDWVLPGALITMGLGLPVILFTGYVHYVTHRAATQTPAYSSDGRRAPGTMAHLAIKASPHLNWRRTTRGGVYALATFVLLIAGFMGLRAMGIGPAGSLFAAGTLNAQDKLLVADFRVSGADTSLSRVVTEAVRTGLGESEVLSILAPTDIASALQRMQRPVTSAVDLALGREIAQREGAKAVVTGDVTPLGAGYVVTMRLVSADSGAELASFHETADSPTELLPTLDKLMRSLRGKAGESLKKVHASAPLENVTTASLDALRKYVEGARLSDAGDATAAIPLLREAIALDTSFAMAHRKLAVAYRNGGFPAPLADTAMLRAYVYRERLPERERGTLMGDYYTQGPGRDRAKGIAAYQTMLARYPNETPAINNLALALFSRRQFAEAESLYRRAIGLDSNLQIGYANVISTLANEGKSEEALKTVADFKRRFPGAPYVELFEARLHYATGKRDTAIALFRAARASRSVQNRIRAQFALASASLTAGRINESLVQRAQGRAEDAARGVEFPPVLDSLGAAFLDIWMRENPARGVQRMEAALVRATIRSLSMERRPYFEVATSYALAGRPEKARAVLAQYEAEVRDSSWRRVLEPARQAALGEIALAEKKPLEALAAFRRADALPDGPSSPCRICLSIRLGRAFDQAGMSDSALVMYEHYVSQPDMSRLAPSQDPTYLAGTHKRLGELYEARGDRANAMSHYNKFVTLWKHADPELQPKVQQVQQRLARLGRIEGR